MYLIKQKLKLSKAFGVKSKVSAPKFMTQIGKETRVVDLKMLSKF